MKNILNLMDFPLKHSHEGSEMRKATKSHVKDVACNKMYKPPKQHVTILQLCPLLYIKIVFIM